MSEKQWLSWQSAAAAPPMIIADCSANGGFEATTALATYDIVGRITSLREAKDLIDGWASETGEPDSDAFVIQLAGVIGNPFEGFA